nr:CHAD domain-containing protein [Caldovatus aquaticus]
MPRRGPRRLVRSLPAPEAPWRPGTPPERIATLADEAAPWADSAGLDAAERAAPLVPLAAFEGRCARFVLAGRGDGDAAAAIEARLLTGRLRAASGAEHDVARLLLAGPAEPVLALARALATTLPLLPPRAALAEEARALARGEPVRPRRAGPPALQAAEEARAALGRALGHLTEALLFHAPLARQEAGPEGVHQMRVALRRLRSVLSLFRAVASAEERPALRAFATRLRALARTLGPARDWDVFLGGLAAELAAAAPGEPRLADLLRAAEARRAEAYALLRAALDGPEFRVLVCDALALALRFAAPEARDAAARTPPSDPPPEPLTRFAAAALERRWRKLRGCARAAFSAEAGEEALHALRLEGKRLRYAAEIFAPLWPGRESRRFVKDLAALQEALGLVNDAATARRLVAALALPAMPHGAAAEAARREDRAWAVGLAEGFVLARTRRARKRALRAWDSLRERAPFRNGR